MRTPATCVSNSRSNSPAIVRHVGRSAAHVEADHPVVAAELRRPRHADDAARRPRQDRVLALEGVRIGEPAGGLHEEQLDARHLAATCST